MRLRIRGNRNQQAFIRCPIQGTNCGAVKPRWVWKQSIRKGGICMSCSKNRGGGINAYGYRVIKFRGKSISEHRYLMSKWLGRKLRKGKLSTIRMANEQTTEK